MLIFCNFTLFKLTFQLLFWTDLSSGHILIMFICDTKLLISFLCAVIFVYSTIQNFIIIVTCSLVSLYGYKYIFQLTSFLNLNYPTQIFYYEKLELKPSVSTTTEETENHQNIPQGLKLLFHLICTAFNEECHFD